MNLHQIKSRRAESKRPFAILLLVAITCLLIAAFSLASARDVRATSSQAPKTPAEILSAAADVGGKLVAAFSQYSYYSEVTIETVSDADVVTGKYYRFSQMIFDTGGNRHEKIIENTSTLPKDIYVGTTTAGNLISVYRFFLTRETLQQYSFNYIGREHIDELNTYVFDLKPKTRLPDPEKSSDRYLKGRIWIDDQDLCVVKVSGEVVPELSTQRKPKFETYYQNQDDFWFPAFSSADDSIKIGKFSWRVAVKVRHTGYKRIEKK